MDRDAGLHDAGFVPGNFLDGVPEDLGVVDAEAGDAGDTGVDDDVRAVVFPTDAAFNDGRVNAFAHVGVEGHQGQEAEVGRFRAFVGWFSSRSRALFQTVPGFEEVLCE